ncbi:MAG TPA: ABC transporter ATP-binding protein [Ktedonobacter sp.]|nr:ABC transporter ATP-binding protein [Ktedonobacter sp.]
MNNQYSFGTTLNMPYQEAIKHVKEALRAEGFGVLTEIDVRKTLQEKLGTEMEPYMILGACNPQLAHRALEQEPEIGLLLPCNVVVRAEGNGSRVEIADPKSMLGIVGNEQLDVIAQEAAQKLHHALSAL